MAEQLVKTPEQIQEEILNEEKDTAIETKSAVWNSRINLELTERTMTKREKKVVENGEAQKLIEIDEDTERRQVSYPTPDKIYRQEAEKAVTHEVKQEAREKPQQKLFLVKINLSRPEPQEKQVAEINTPREKLKPTIETIEPENSGAEELEVPEVESFSFTANTSAENFQEVENAEEQTVYSETGQDYTEPEPEGFSPPEPGVENPFTPDLKSEEEYLTGGEALVPETRETEYIDFSPVLDDFEDLESYEVFGNSVLQVEHGEDSEISERLVLNLESMFPYQDSVSGSEAVETLWHEYGVEATVAEVPYFSENSGESWDEGWNSFDMVLQMNGMSMLDTEYLSGDLYELGGLEQPVQNSIDKQFDTSQSIEFRESEEFSNHTGGYTASDRTQNAWVKEYGEEILELNPVERGVYAAFEDGESFRGAPLEMGEVDFMSDKAVEML